MSDRNKMEDNPAFTPMTEVQVGDDFVRRSTVVYGDEKKKWELGRQQKMANGKKIDFVLVYQLPKDPTLRRKVLDASNSREVKEDPKPVKSARKRDFFERKLKDAGVLLEKEVSKDGEVLYTKIHVPFEVLLQKAEDVKLKLPLTEEASEHLKSIKSTGFEKLQSLFKYPPLLQGWLDHGVPEEPDYFSGPFMMAQRHRFKNTDNEEACFTQSQRILLTYNLLQEIRYAKKEDQVGIGKLLANGGYTAVFPLHDGPVDPDTIEYTPGIRNKLWKVWGSFGAWHYYQPLELIREYFGEKITMYYAWLGFYTTALFIPSILGVLAFIYGLGGMNKQQDSKDVCDSNMTMCPQCGTCETWVLNTACTAYKFSYVFDNGVTIAFALFMSLWASVFMDFWRRKNAELAYDWDVLDLEEEEPARPQFKAQAMRPNVISGKLEKWYPKTRRAVKYVGSGMTIFAMIFIVIMVVVSVIVYRLAVRAALYAHSSEGSSVHKNAPVITTITAAILNLIGIMVLNNIYGKLALKLTDWENHKRETKYEAHLTFKIFLFQFVNSYSSIFYIAFFKGRFVGYPGNYNTIFGYRQDECPPYGCLLEVTIQLMIIMVGKQAISNMQEVFLPMLFAYLRKRKLGEKKDAPMLPWEDEYLRLGMYPALGMFSEYLEMIMQFGFITLFVAAFPLAPFFALVNNILEIRVDAEKLVTGYRRPPPLRAENIGIWEGVLETVSFLSVITNGLVIAVTSDYLAKEVYRRHHDGSLTGYLDSITPLSPVDPNSNQTDANCHYIAFRDATGARNIFYWEVIAAKLAFLVAFEHCVFGLKFFIQYVIPNVPHHVKIAIEREAYLARQALEKVSVEAGLIKKDDAASADDGAPDASDDDMEEEERPRLDTRTSSNI